MVKSRYRGDPDQANRLYAARIQAGFASGRAAALRAGIAESKLRAHETAEIPIGPADGRRYADVFNVSSEWLRTGRGPGPEVDVARAARLKIRSDAVAQRDLPLPQTAAARLRLARRLAGFASVTEAAKRHGWTRSRLSAHETGQNKISADHAREYAERFDVEPRWLATGEGHSGYPPQIHVELEKLLALHDLAEGEVSPRLPVVKPRQKISMSLERDFAEKLQIPKIAKPKRNLMVLGEYDALKLAAFAAGHPSRREITPVFEWGFPEGYIQEVLKADPASSFIVAIRNPAPNYHLWPGDRILINGGDREPRKEGIFVVVRGESIQFVGAQHLREVQKERPFECFVLGRWIGRIGLP